ncbi:MAG: PIN domain-containing protein [Chlorobi bacterium]|nr:PIN domain-containing protein [Chlorobiota bacterium]
MKRLFIDTNIVIDLLSRRKDFYEEAATLFSLADKNNVHMSVSALTIANTHFILLKKLNTEKAKEILRNFRLLVDVLPLDEKIVDLALNDKNFTDFEDALQYYSALQYGMEIIITRNSKDFKKSELPVMTALQYLKST